MARPSAPDAHAEQGECTPALAISSMLTCAAGPLGMSIGTVSGETLRSPWASRRSSWSSRVFGPPIPVPMATPSRSGSTGWLSSVGISYPASAHACRAAMIATCSQRSSRRSCTRGSTSDGSTASGAASRAGRSYFSTHSASLFRMPLRPAISASQVDATSPPSGVVAPMPVTTTSTVLIAPSVGLRPPVLRRCQTFLET